MLVDQLRQAWRARSAHAGLQAKLCFEADALVLGAGTVLAKANDPACGLAGPSGDQRLAALLSVAYGPTVAAGALSHVRAAIARRKAGDLAGADLHLALSKLDRLRHPEDASRRLFMADGLIRSGVSPEAILEVLREGPSEGVGLTKYSPDQPRVPAGSGLASGEWTSGDSPAPPASVNPPSAKPTAPTHRTKTPQSPTTRPGASARSLQVNPAPKPPAPTVASPVPRAATTHPLNAVYVGPAPIGPAVNIPSLGEVSAGAIQALARFIPALIGSEAVQATIATGGVIGVLGILFVPSTGPKGQWVKVGGPGDISYYQNPDELQIRLKYTTPDGVQHLKGLVPGLDGEIRTPDGQVVGRIVKVGAGTAILVSAAALGIDPINEPQLCPAYKKDRYQGPLGKRYEKQMKAMFNPLNPTPSGMAYYFYDPNSGKFPAIDDCQQQTGALAEYKGPGYEYHMLKNDGSWQGMRAGILSQSKRQAGAAGDRPITWYFAEKGVADYFRKAFEKPNSGRENIRVEWVPIGGIQ